MWVMKKTKILTAVTAALAPSLFTLHANAAQHHHICYEDQPVVQNGTTYYKAVAQCRADDGPCVIAPGNGTDHTSDTTSSVRSYFYTATFADGSTQHCTVNVNGRSPTLGSTLVGYTTDQSGLLTTGVWKRRSTQRDAVAGYNRSYQTVRLPGDFVTVGGGVVGEESPFGTLVYRSEANGGWGGGTVDNPQFPEPADNDVYVIGMRIWDLDGQFVAPWVRETTASSSGALSQPSASVNLPSGDLPLSGGITTLVPFSTNLANLGQYATSTAPALTWTAGPLVACPVSNPGACMSITGWNAASKDHLVAAPGSVTARIVSITGGDVTINNDTWHFEGTFNMGTSATAAHPSVVVSGKPGEFALTGIGATANWQTSASAAGSLLWKLMPRPDIAGAEVGSKDHGISSPATITGYALGIKLVHGSGLVAKINPNLLPPIMVKLNP
jgi:hypothetical protein